MVTSELYPYISNYFVFLNIIADIILDSRKGGSYTDRSFLRSAMFPKPGSDNKTMVIAYGRGSGLSDHKVIVQEVGTDRYLQEIAVAKPITDICYAILNQNHYVVVLCETEIAVYKWS